MTNATTKLAKRLARTPKDDAGYTDLLGLIVAGLVVITLLLVINHLA